MPSASTELQEKMREYYGSPIDDAGPTKWLKSQGFSLTGDWCWEPPARVTSYDALSEQEWLTIKFLIDEWDFGGLKLPEGMK